MTKIATIIPALLVSGAFSVAASAFAAAPGATEAVLRNPQPSPVAVIIDGRQWRCEGSACVASASDVAQPQSVARECMRAAAKLGPFESYQTGAKMLSGDQLGACNTAAVQTPTLASAERR